MLVDRRFAARTRVDRADASARLHETGSEQSRDERALVFRFTLKLLRTPGFIEAKRLAVLPSIAFGDQHA
jgi:hypothetical protein